MLLFLEDSFEFMSLPFPFPITINLVSFGYRLRVETEMRRAERLGSPAPFVDANFLHNRSAGSSTPSNLQVVQKMRSQGVWWSEQTDPFTNKLRSLGQAAASWNFLPIV